MPQIKKRRTFNKNSYEAEHRRGHEKATTPEYEATRGERPKIERKLGEMARHQGARRACFRGIGKVLGQALLTALAVNVKRMIKMIALSEAKTKSALGAPALGAPALRAEASLT